MGRNGDGLEAPRSSGCVVSVARGSDHQVPRTAYIVTTSIGRFLVELAATSWIRRIPGGERTRLHALETCEVGQPLVVTVEDAPGVVTVRELGEVVAIAEVTVASY